MKEKVLVIGSNSFSGSHFVDQCIRKGHQTWGISRSKEPSSHFLPYIWDYSKNHLKDNKAKYTFHRLDMNKDIEAIFELIQQVEPEIIVNFAAQGMVAESWNQPIDWYETNLLAQVRLVSELKDKKFIKKYVQISTPEVYGDTGENWRKEDFMYNPSTPYAISKAACDMHLKCLHESYGFPVIYTRAANVYGPAQQLYRIIPKTIISAVGRRKMILHGGGITKRSFIHIKDVSSATLQLALEAKPGTIWHIASRNDITIKELVLKIFEACKGDYQECVEIGEERKSKDSRYRISSENLRSTYNWNTKITLEEGINETIDWVKSNWSYIKNLDTTYVHKK